MQNLVRRKPLLITMALALTLLVRWLAGPGGAPAPQLPAAATATRSLPTSEVAQQLAPTRPLATNVPPPTRLLPTATPAPTPQPKVDEAVQTSYQGCALITEDTVRLRASPNGEFMAYANRGLPVTLLGEQQEIDGNLWAKLRIDNVERWVAAQFVQPMPCRTYSSGLRLPAHA